MPGIVKTPSMPFYGKDAYDDETFSRLSFGAHGLWLFLSWWQWQEGSIPEDPELVFDRLPRRKVREARVFWTEVEPLFPVVGDGRRRNDTTEKHRDRIAHGAEGKRRGAEKTNLKRWGFASHSDSHSDSVSDSLTDGAATRSTLHMQLQEEKSQSSEEREGVQGEDKFAIAARLMPNIAAAEFKYMPPEQIVVSWLGAGCDEKLILEALAVKAHMLRGKRWELFQRIITDWRDDPSQRPSHRLKRGAGGNGSGRAASLDGLQVHVQDDRMRRVDEIRELGGSLKTSLAALDAGGEWWRDDCSPEQARGWIELLSGEYGGRFDEAPTLEQFVKEMTTHETRTDADRNSGVHRNPLRRKPSR